MSERIYLDKDTATYFETLEESFGITYALIISAISDRLRKADTEFWEAIVERDNTGDYIPQNWLRHSSFLRTQRNIIGQLDSYIANMEAEELLKRKMFGEMKYVAIHSASVFEKLRTKVGDAQQ